MDGKRREELRARIHSGEPDLAEQYLMLCDLLDALDAAEARIAELERERENYKQICEHCVSLLARFEHVVKETAAVHTIRDVNEFDEMARVVELLRASPWSGANEPASKLYDSTIMRLRAERDEARKELAEVRERSEELDNECDQQADEVVEMKDQRDELQREIMRLPAPPSDMDDNPASRVLCALARLAELGRDLGAVAYERNAAQRRIEELEKALAETKFDLAGAREVLTAETTRHDTAKLLDQLAADRGRLWHVEELLYGWRVDPPTISQMQFLEAVDAYVMAHQDEIEARKGKRKSQQEAKP